MQKRSCYRTQSSKIKSVSAWKPWDALEVFLHRATKHLSNDNKQDSQGGAAAAPGKLRPYNDSLLGRSEQPYPNSGLTDKHTHKKKLKDNLQIHFSTWKYKLAGSSCSCSRTRSYRELTTESEKREGKYDRDREGAHRALCTLLEALTFQYTAGEKYVHSILLSAQANTGRGRQCSEHYLTNSL